MTNYKEILRLRSLGINNTRIAEATAVPGVPLYQRFSERRRKESPGRIFVPWVKQRWPESCSEGFYSRQKMIKRYMATIYAVFVSCSWENVAIRE